MYGKLGAYNVYISAKDMVREIDIIQVTGNRVCIALRYTKDTQKDYGPSSSLPYTYLPLPLIPTQLLSRVISVSRSYVPFREHLTVRIYRALKRVIEVPLLPIKRNKKDESSGGGRREISILLSSLKTEQRGKIDETNYYQRFRVIYCYVLCGRNIHYV